MNACISDALKQLLHQNLEVIPVFISFPVTDKQISAETKICSKIQSHAFMKLEPQTIDLSNEKKNSRRHLGQLLAFKSINEDRHNR